MKGHSNGDDRALLHRLRMRLGKREPTTAELIHELADAVQTQLGQLHGEFREVREQAAFTEGIARLARLEEQVSTLQTLTDGMHTRLNKLRRDMGRPWTLAQSEPEPEFLDLANEVHEHGTTGLPVERLYVLWQAAKNVRALPGSAAEIGAFRGGSAYFIARALQ